MSRTLQQLPIPETAAGPAIPLKAYAYWGNQARADGVFPGTLRFKGERHPISGVLLERLPLGLGVDLRCSVEVADIGPSPDFGLGQVWGVRLKRPIVALSLWLNGADAASFDLRWRCGFKFLGSADVAASGDWRSGLHQKDPLMSLQLILARRENVGDADPA